MTINHNKTLHQNYKDIQLIIFLGLMTLILSIDFKAKMLINLPKIRGRHAFFNKNLNCRTQQVLIKINIWC